MSVGRARWGVLVAVALVAAATGCGGSGGDKAGGANHGTPVVLKLESEDDLSLSGAPEFAEAVERLSGGSMRIEFVRAQRSLEVQFETPYAAGQVLRQRWSVYRDSLTFSRMPGSDADLLLLVKPLTRLG